MSRKSHWGSEFSRATLYRFITIYRQTPTVEALEPRQRGRRKGTLFLDKARHELIRKTIREVYLKPQRLTLTYLVEEVHLRFAQQGWPLPDRRTIKARSRSNRKATDGAQAPRRRRDQGGHPGAGPVQWPRGRLR